MTRRNRIDRVTTRTGDHGETSLADGHRYRKHDARITLVGELDEANSFLGLLAAETELQRHDHLAEQLAAIQSRLFDAGAVVAVGASRSEPAEDWKQLAASLAEETKRLNKNLPPLREFILPSGGRAASTAHVARAVVRRAERTWWQACESDEALRSVPIGVYLNRLSDYLFVLARSLAEDERLWLRQGANVAQGISGALAPSSGSDDGSQS